MCLKDPYSLFLKPFLDIQYVKESQLNFKVSLCVNSTENNHTCKSVEEIKYLLKYVTVQVSLPKTIFDFKNKTNPVKRMFMYEDYKLNWETSKFFYNSINPVYLFEDAGYFNDDYFLRNINFNPSQRSMDFISKSLDDTIFFQYQIYLSYQNEKYYIRNQKLSDILGNFGGIINILFTLGNFVCFYLNGFYFMISLINLSFSFDLKTSKGRIARIFSK